MSAKNTPPVRADFPDIASPAAPESIHPDLVQNYQALRSENQELRTRVAALESDKRRLEDTLDTARVRLEALMSRLPVQAE